MEHWGLQRRSRPGILNLPPRKQLTTLDRTKAGNLVNSKAVNALSREFRDSLTETRDNPRLVTMNEDDSLFWEMLDVHACAK